jgi:hypothetical protein
MGLLQFPSNSMHPYSKLLTRTSEKANRWLILLTNERCWVFPLFSIAGTAKAANLFGDDRLKNGAPHRSVDSGWRSKKRAPGLARPLARFALAQALSSILNDSATASRLGQAGKVRALSDYSQATYVSRVEGIYNELIERRRVSS